MTPRTPSYRHHKPTGQAVVTLNGKDIYLGRYDAPASRERYDRLIADWLARGRKPEPEPVAADALTVDELLATYWKYAESYYRTADGSAAQELDNIRYALRPLRRLFGSTPAREFGPKSLKLVRQQMIIQKWCRTSINRQISRIRSVFRWAAEEELLSGEVYHALQAVAPLKRGRCEAKESDPVKPVPETCIAAIQPYVSRQVWAVIQLQLRTGAREGELLQLRPIDLDTSDPIWTFSPHQHKTAHHGHSRTVHFGARAQEVLGPFLAGRAVDAYLFSLAEAEQERHARQRERGRTPVQPSQAARGELSRQRARRRPPGQYYTNDSYYEAIQRACRKAGVAPWHPHQLRHNHATNVRREFGLEGARVALGQRSVNVTGHYAEIDDEKARAIVRQIG